MIIKKQLDKETQPSTSYSNKCVSQQCRSQKITTSVVCGWHCQL